MALLSSKTVQALLGDPVKAEAKNCGLWLSPNLIANLPKYDIDAIPRRIYMHKAMMAPFTQVYLTLCNTGLQSEIQAWDGCFNIRKMKKIVNGKLVFSTIDSLHSWALALDINASQNPLGKKPTMHYLIVQIFKENGFDWGGDFKVPDGMHFQLKEDQFVYWVKRNKIKPA